MTRALLELLTQKYEAIEVCTSVIRNDRLYIKNMSKLLSSYDHTILCLFIRGYSYVPPGFPNSTAQQQRQTRQKGAYQ